MKKLNNKKLINQKNKNEVNEAFIMYDALISFLVFSSFLVFFNKMLWISQAQYIATQNQIKANEVFRKSIYTFRETNKYYFYQNKDIKTYMKGDNYCVEYNAYKTQKEICN